MWFISRISSRLLFVWLLLLLKNSTVLVDAQVKDDDENSRIQRVRQWFFYTLLRMRNTCPSDNRCGKFDRSYPMYVIRNSGQCTDACISTPSLFIAAGYKCGTCANLGIVAPPAPTPIIVPTPTSSNRVCTARDPRCYFGLAYQQYRGVQDSPECDQICSFNAVLRDDFDGCGYCDSRASLAPVPQRPPVSPIFPTVPVNRPTLMPTVETPSQTDTPTTGISIPTKAPGVETTAPTKAPISGTASPTKAPIPGTAAPTISPVVGAPSSTDAPTLSPVDGTAQPTSGTTTPMTPTQVPNNGGGGYQITLDLQMPELDKAIFDTAGGRWESIITGDLPDVESAGLPPARTGCTYPTVIDDLYICGLYEKMDGPNGQVGFGTVTSRRDNNNGLPVAGEMRFDTEDLETLNRLNLLDKLILHEMGHVLGIGVIWMSLGVQGMENCPYTGPIATAEFKALSGCNEIPIEQTGGDGTRCKHWSESCFGSELMTGTLNVNENPLSRMTIASLADIGYEVSYDNADDYAADQLNQTDSTCYCKRRLKNRNLMGGGEGNVFAIRNQKNNTQYNEGLPPEIYELAMERGRKILKENSYAASHMSEGEDNYVSGNWVSVIWIYEEILYSVIVTNP